MYKSESADQSAKRQEILMKHEISDETVDYVGILSKLEITGDEKEKAKADIAEMLDYIDKLGELDTDGVEPLTHVMNNPTAFREDEVTNGDGHEETLANAPEVQDQMLSVPKTF